MRARWAGYTGHVWLLYYKDAEGVVRMATCRTRGAMLRCVVKLQSVGIHVYRVEKV